jgi:two-component system cell cycle sensor histidine kinase/response regulator CckA
MVRLGRQNLPPENYTAYLVSCILHELQDAMTILIAEDDFTVREHLALILEFADYTVLSARSGLEAIALSRSYRQPIDLLITDIRMPGVDGLTLAGLLQHQRPDTPVIFMSADLEQHRLPDQAVSIEKPFSARDILDLVASRSPVHSVD